jgi:undecaprenyl-diphosphatase
VVHPGERVDDGRREAQRVTALQPVMALVRRRLVVWLVLGVALPLALFLVLAENVVERPIDSWDRGALRAIAHLHTSVRTHLLRIVTFFGGSWGIALLTVAALIILALLHRHRDALFVAAAGAGSGILQLVTKLAIERPRPSVFLPLTQVTSYSYPSGHAMASATLALTLLVVCWRTRWRWAVLFGGAVYAPAVAFSRLYLGVHYPSDILAGWSLAVAWLVALHLVFDGSTACRTKQAAREAWATDDRDSGRPLE